MRTIILFTFLLFTFCFSAFAQDYEYGKPSELKNLKKIFVDTGSDLKNHDLIVKEIERAKIGDLIFLASEKGAEIILMFRDENKSSGATATTTNIGGIVTTNVDEDSMETGAGGVFVFPSGFRGDERMRIVMDFKDTRRGKIEKHPATNFGKNFIKQYKTANDLK